MKYIKMLGLAAVAAMASMAFLGANSASATVLCKTPNLTEGCAASGWDYPKGTVIDASVEAGTTLRLKNTSGTTLMTCTASTVRGETTNTGGSSETVDGNLSVLTFEACDSTIHIVKLGLLEVHWLPGTDNGTLTSKDAEVTITIFGVSGGYSTFNGTDVGIATGGSMGTGDFDAIVKKSNGGFLCPETAVWEGKYTITEPEGPIYISTS